MNLTKTDIINELINYRGDLSSLIIQKRKLLKNFINKNQKKTCSVSFIGGYTTEEICDWAKIFMLIEGVDIDVKPSLWGGVHEIAPSHNIAENLSEIFVLFCSWRDLYNITLVEDSNFEIVFKEISKFVEVSISQGKTCIIIPFDQPHFDILLSDQTSIVSKIVELNSKIFEMQKNNPLLIVMPKDDLLIERGLPISPNRDWHLYGRLLSVEAEIFLAFRLSRLLINIISSRKKVLVVDLDNTIWGGIIGDDGVENIKLGPETPIGRVFWEIQSYLLMLKRKGIILAVCSKNELDNAIGGLSHPYSLLKKSDFSAFKSNWDPKSKNIKLIADELNLGLESFVFLDDNIFERQEVMNSLPSVSVPDIGEDESQFIKILNQLDYFGSYIPNTNEDYKRVEMYSQESLRNTESNKFDDFDSFLESLNIEVCIYHPNKNNYERVIQLSNKTNQFNLTTFRVDLKHLLSYLKDKNKEILVLEAKDKFGSYGLVSVCYLSFENDNAVIDNWLMSCRAFGKKLENEMIKAIIKLSISKNTKKIFGYYIPTKKNRYVENIYPNFGFKIIKSDDNDRYVYVLDIDKFDFLKFNSSCRVSYEF